MIEQRITSPGRLALLEGLRGFLALYVVLDHTLEYSGYVDELARPLFFLRAGRYAVDEFVILSGFVIFYLLDKHAEDYRAFLTRRFFRLYPVAILMFAVSVPISLLRLWNINHAGTYSSPEHIHSVTSTVHAWWAHWGWNTALHGTLLHGLVPDRVLPHASEAFLDPAWSISLEWQFYLVAPLCYWLATKGRSARLCLCLACAAIVLVRPWLPGDLYGASLPFHVEFFFLGGASYFAYKRARGRAPLGTPALLVALVVVLVFVTRGHPHELAPVYLWAIVLGLLCAKPADRFRDWLSRPLVHPWAQHLGRVSYSVYLAHLPLLAVVQFALLTLAPGVDRVAHFWLLFAGTLLVTLPLSTLLYAKLELPFMRLGRALTASWAGRSEVPVRVEAVP